MRKRRNSDKILQESGLRRWKKSFRPRKRRRFKLKENWWLASKIKRHFNPGIITLDLDGELDIFQNPERALKFFEALSYPDFKTIHLNLKNLKFIYPEFVVYLAAVSDHLLRLSNAEIVEFKPKLHEVDEYLKLCGLRSFFFVRIGEKVKDPQLFGDCIPLSRDAQDRTSVATKISQLICEKTKMQASENNLNEAIGELMGNAIEHGQVKHWYRIAQIHTKRKLITIAIADNGVGVPKTLKGGYQPALFKSLSDAQILRRSFDADVTRFAPKFGEVHGNGLEYSYTFAKQLKGQVAMLSGHGFCALDFSTGDEIKTLRNYKTSFPGTLVVIRIPF